MKLICLLSWCPLRSSNSSSSEMVSSLLFGETAELIETVDDWFKVKCDHDGYEGWVSSSTMRPAETEQLEWKTRLAVHGAVWQNIDARIDLSPGSLMPSDGQLDVYGHHFRFSDPRAFVPEEYDPVSLAVLFKYTPYLWGGRSVWGIDCSGLIQVLHLMVGKALPRDASEQAKVGESVDFSQRRRGDLAFFEKEGKIVHVGILADEQSIIHASGRVRTDELNHQGIINCETGLLTHTLHSVRRIS